MTAAIARAGILAAVVVLGGFIASHAAFQKQDDAADAARLGELLAMGAGSTVADVGGGSGALVRLMSTRVGATGLLYAM